LAGAHRAVEHEDLGVQPVEKRLGDVRHTFSFAPRGAATGSGDSPAQRRCGVAGADPGSKADKARELKVEMIGEEEFLRRLGRGR